MAALEEEKSKGGSTEITRGDRLAARMAAKAAQKAADRGKTPIAINRLAEKAGQTSDWIKERQKPMLSLLACCVLLAVGLIAWRVYAERSSHEASALLEKAVSTANAAILSEEGALDQEPVDESYPSSKERAKKSLQEFRKVVAKYPNTIAAQFGKLGEANEQFVLGKYEQARKAYSKALEKADDNNFVKWRALEGIGFSQEAVDKYDDAEKTFATIGTIADGAYKFESDYHVARMQLARGKTDAASKKLTALLKELKKRESLSAMDHAFVRHEVETRLRELGIDPDDIKVASDEKTKKPAKSEEKAK